MGMTMDQPDGARNLFRFRERAEGRQNNFRITLRQSYGAARPCANQADNFLPERFSSIWRLPIVGAFGNGRLRQPDAVKNG